MIRTEPTSGHFPQGAQRVRLRYGLNETDNWWHFALGPRKEQIRDRVRAMGTSVIRTFLFEKHAPDPVSQWPLYRAYLQAVLDAGARPMVTFAKFPPPYDDPAKVHAFAARCADVVWGCIEQWGGERVRDWYWGIWNEPNCEYIGGGLTFPQYRRVYEEVAAVVRQELTPHLGGRKAMIGGPAVDGFDPFWMDWVWRFVNEIDNALIGFVSWHRYGDWRPDARNDAPQDACYRAVLTAQTPEYEARSRGVARLLAGRDILNFCEELNVLANPDIRASRRFNQTAFGAAYYASALKYLIRGGADLEMWWTATDELAGYGMVNSEGEPNPVCHAKELFARYVRHGDWVTFPESRRDGRDIDALVSLGEDDRRAGVFVNLRDGPRELNIADWNADLDGCQTVLRVDSASGSGIVREPFDGIVRFDGHGVAVVTTAAESEGGGTS